LLAPGERLRVLSPTVLGTPEPDRDADRKKPADTAEPFARRTPLDTIHDPTTCVNRATRIVDREFRVANDVAGVRAPLDSNSSRPIMQAMRPPRIPTREAVNRGTSIPSVQHAYTPFT
jgi:hypothetical protein